ncbi:hypothetical protein AUP68_04136 [Ilyonectria robusta]
MATAQTYRRLEAADQETRFIVLQSTLDLDEIVHGTLHVCSLRTCAPYYALSYVWGSAASPSPIRINCNEHSVTTNLEASLRQLRASGFTDVPIWIDAVCINQADIAERNEQVRIMGHIYRNAKLVIGWLGPSSETSDLAIQTIKSWNDKHEVLQGRGDQDISVDIREISENGALTSEDATEGIVQLFEKEWWFRQWISQEIILADDILLMCGGQQLRWRTICGANSLWRALTQPDYAELLENWQQIRVGCMKNTVLNLFEELRSKRTTDGTDDTMLLSSLLPAFRGFKASDPRDKIFALLGFASDGSIIAPNYQLPISALYTEHFARLLRTSGNLNLLRHCFLHEGNSQQGIPSWVPDWSHSGIPVSMPEEKYNCAAHIEPRYSLSEDIYLLRIEGVIVSSVARTVPAKYLLPPLTPQEEAGCSAGKSLIADQKNALYLNGDSWGVRLFRTILLDIDPTTSKRFDLHSRSFFGLLFSYCWYLRHFHNVSDRTILNIWFGQEDSLENRNELNRMTGLWPKTYEPHLLRGFRTERRHLFVLEDGELGMGPEGMRGGDLVCALLGCRVPFALRRFEQGYGIVGECFLVGIMDGEVVERIESGDLNVQAFDIY